MKIWILIGVIALTVGSLFLYLLYALFKLMAGFITGYGAFLVYIAAIVYIVRYVIRALVFPGSCIFIRKIIEYNIRKSMTKIIMSTVCNFRYTLEDTSQLATLDDGSAQMLMEGVSEIKKMIQSIITNNNRQHQLGTLTPDQEAFQHRIEDLKQAIVSIRLLKSGTNMINITLWDADAETHDIQTIIGCSYSENLKAKINELDDFCTYLSVTMDVEYTSTKNPNARKECTFFQSVRKTTYVYWFNTSYGHLDQVRVDLEKSYKGQQEFIKMKDSSVIDTMWIENSANVGRRDSPTVLF